MRFVHHPIESVSVKPWKAITDVVPDAKPETISFLRWVTFIVLDDPRAFTDGQQQSVVKMRRWAKVIDAFESSKPGEYIPVDDQDYATLKLIVENPQRAFQNGVVQITLACMPYVDAILEAKSELPAVVNQAQAS
jgi:hypothetical protein